MTVPLSTSSSQRLLCLKTLPVSLSLLTISLMLGVSGCADSNLLAGILGGQSTQVEPSAQTTATQTKTDKRAQAVNLNNQGVEKLQQADYQGALTAFQQAIQADAKLAEAYLGQGIAYAELEKTQDALASYNQAIRLNDKFAAAYLNRADEYVTLGNQQRAIADLKQAKHLFQQQGDQDSVQLAQTRLKAVQAAANPAAVMALAPKPAPPPRTLVSAPVAATPVTPTRKPASGRSPSTSAVSAEVALASHLTRIGAKMYGTYWCPYCRRQEELFKEAVRQLTIIECDPNGTNPQPDLCNAANVSSYPTWEINGQLYRGMRSLQDLADLSGYRGDRNFRS